MILNCAIFSLTFAVSVLLVSAMLLRADCKRTEASLDKYRKDNKELLENTHSKDEELESLRRKNTELEEWLNKMKTNTGDVVETGYGEIRVKHLPDDLCAECPYGRPDLDIRKSGYGNFFLLDCKKRSGCYLLQYKIKTMLAEKKEDSENDPDKI